MDQLIHQTKESFFRKKKKKKKATKCSIEFKTNRPTSFEHTSAGLSDQKPGKQQSGAATTLNAVVVEPSDPARKTQRKAVSACCAAMKSNLRPAEQPTACQASTHH
jgi:hypothetical protein